ncbi:MAG: hypothetical protein SV201_14095 [Pseudomonadota bacterium]|nr:hypothetical protein [Pseudomonadota bacterium]
MPITPLEASRQTGKSKTAILKAIKSGRVSATKDANGQWQIDPAELFRVYPAVSGDGVEKSSAEHSGLQTEIELLRQRCSFLEDKLADAKDDRDHWRQQATALLSDQRGHTAPQKPADGRLARAWAILRGNA